MGALERIMLSMARSEFCKRGKMTVTSVNMKTLKKHWKNVHKLVHDEIQGWQRSLTIMQKLKQNKNVSKTIGESNISECHTSAKCGINKFHLEFFHALTLTVNLAHREKSSLY